MPASTLAANKRMENDRQMAGAIRQPLMSERYMQIKTEEGDMKKLLILTSILIFFIATNAKSEDCEIPGKTIHWIVDYCMYQAETDDFLAEQVQTCFEKNQGYKTKDTCENKKKYKMKICKHLAGMGHFNGNAEICFKDTKLIPTTVKNGGI